MLRGQGRYAHSRGAALSVGFKLTLVGVGWSTKGNEGTIHRQLHPLHARGPRRAAPAAKASLPACWMEADDGAAAEHAAWRARAASWLPVGEAPIPFEELAADLVGNELFWSRFLA